MRMKKSLFDALFRMRLSPEQDALFERAAWLAGLSKSAWARHHLFKIAKAETRAADAGRKRKR